MNYQAVLFDLDGTLLPMDQDLFVKTYFGLLAKRLATHGYDPEQLIGAVWAGTKDMLLNDGTQTNEQVFWKRFGMIFGEKAVEDEPLFAAFYETDFDQVQAVCGCNREAAKIISYLKEQGVQVALATNPIFPKEATRRRIRWAGLREEDFELYTTYENSSFSKPNLRYYEEILKKLQLRPEECLMVGNDVEDDLVAAELGMDVFLLTDCLINNKERDLSSYPQGGFSELMEFLKGTKKND